ncbi:hypothetical protein [Nonomuraea composti]|uniref:hypothetical protein n=1 Tax=Nonomuraea composti TaxID=2720023 RepID=UPI0019819D21|nr:hypothetical protein [Nonomuraea sp. FMUSA5-5]
MTDNQDGSINIEIYDLREPAQLEQDLAGRGVTAADFTYLPLGKRCGNTRAPALEGDDVGAAGREPTAGDAAARARLLDQLHRTPSYQAIRPKDGITVYPRHIERG